MTCSSHSDRRGDSGLLVGQVCRSGQLCRAKTCWRGDAGPWKVLDSVAAGSAGLLSGTGVGFASSCFFTDILNASNSQGPRSAQRVWPHTGHLHTQYTPTVIQAHTNKHTSMFCHQPASARTTNVFLHTSVFHILFYLIALLFFTIYYLMHTYRTATMRRLL